VDDFPLVHQRLGRQIRTRILWGAGALALAAVLLVIQVPRATRLVTFVLLTLWCHGPLSPLLPAAYEPVLLAYGQLFAPVLLAVIGAVASTGVEYVTFYLYRRLLQFKSISGVLSGSPAHRLTSLFLRRPFFTVWICVLSPLPDWGARVLAAHSGYSVSRYLTAVLLARLPRFWFLAALGFHLELGVGVVLLIVAASAVVTFIGLWRRQPTPASAKAAMPISVLLLLGVMSAPLPLGRLEGQETPPRLAGKAMGVSMDRFMYEGSGLVAISYRFSTLRSGGIGPELGVSLFPQTLPAGVLALAPDLGASYNLPVPGGSLLIKAGGSAISAIGTAGLLFVPGFHAAGTVIVQTGRRSGLRIDVIRHYYLPGGEEIYPIWSVGLGFAVLPRARS